MLKIHPDILKKYLADEVAGEYTGHIKYIEGNNRLGSNINRWLDYMKEGEATAQITKISNNEVNISFHSGVFPVFTFNNNWLKKQDGLSKLFIEGDWITGWGIIGKVDLINQKLIIDINPVNYAKTPNSGINPDSLLNRYVMLDGAAPFGYKTVFNLEFEGVL